MMLHRREKKHNVLGDGVVRHNLLLVIDWLKMETLVSLLTLRWVPYEHVYMWNIPNLD